ncbi:Tetracycline resistance protein, class C [Dyadobacter sp. CECT 9275]|uniref:Tetracycline resistance protein, class C n=1 Tax=Dyadobacter helix TaxID=2822344 RepID=A0A916JGZ8_9BACT|nr:TCR/Tet family MFS transporter [Dyadobacter sp. CECT 9275]CAG5012577.1 Tetracycline resistance protein, class C [Dyadobacter sp. CECT 9275]
MAQKKSPALGFIFVTLLIDIIGLGIIIPVMPKLIAELTGDSISEASRDGGWLLFAYSFTQFICAPIIGGLSDRFGRRPVLLASLFGFGIDYIFLAFAPTLAWLYVGRVIAGLMGASFTTGAAYIADISTPEKRAANFGLLGAAFGLGFIIGPVMGGLLGQYGSRVPFMAAAGLSLLNFLYGYFILPESLLPENRRKFEWGRANPIGSLQRLKNYPVIYGLIASLTLLYIALHAVQSNWSFYVIEKFGWNEAQIGYSLGAVGLLSAFIQGYLIRLILPKLGQKRGVYLGLLLYAVGFGLYAFASEGWTMYVFMIPYILGSIAGPSLQGIISTQVARNEQGELQGALTSLQSLTSIIGPPLMTNLFAVFTKAGTQLYFPGAPMLVAAFLTLISTFLARRSLKKNFEH